MSLHRLFRMFALGMVLMLVLAACGEAAAPTATGPVAVPTAGATQVPGPTPPPAVASTSEAPIPVVSGYAPDVVREMLAQNMYLPGMTWGAGETPRYGGTGTYSVKADVTHEDPMTGSNTIAGILSSVYGRGGLVSYEDAHNDTFKPYLAESWSLSEDLKSWTFKVRQGVKWHNGKALTAEDVAYYINIATKPPKGRQKLWTEPIFNGMQPVELIDANTVRLTFAEPNPHFLETFSSYSFAIGFPKDLAEAELAKGNLTFGRTAVNSVALGPFKFDTHAKGSSYRAVRSELYWDKDEAGRALPYLDSVYFPIIPDTNVALSAFRAGRLSSTGRGNGTNLDPEMIEVLKRDMPGKFWILRHTYLNYGLQVNVLKPPFTDIRVRKAINLYLDREDSAQKLYGGFAYSAGMVNPGSWWFSGDYVNWPGFNQKTKKQDQAEALRLIDEAGVKGMALTITDRLDYTFIAEYNESVLRQMGFDPKIKMNEIGPNSAFKSAMLHHTATGGLPSGGLPLTVLLGYVSWNAESSNKTGDTKIDAWEEIVRTSVDPVARRTALWEAERYIVAEQHYAHPHYRGEQLVGYRTYLKGQTVPGWAAGFNADRARDWIDPSLS